MRKKSVPPDDPEQSKRFIETAREIETDESPDGFERAFERIIKPKEVTPSGSHPRRSVKRPES